MVMAVLLGGLIKLFSIVYFFSLSRTIRNKDTVNFFLFNGSPTLFHWWCGLFTLQGTFLKYWFCFGMVKNNKTYRAKPIAIRDTFHLRLVTGHMIGFVTFVTNQHCFSVCFSLTYHTSNIFWRFIPIYTLVKMNAMKIKTRRWCYLNVSCYIFSFVFIT